MSEDGATASAEQLRRVAAYESRIRPTLLTRIFRVIGRTRLFAAIYKRIGPKLDTFLMRHARFTNRLLGLPSLLLVTTGARSGQPRTSPLIYMRDSESFVVVGTNFGQSHHPAWTANLLAHPRAAIEIGAQRLLVQ